MHLRLTYLGVVLSAAYLALALGPDVYEMLVHGSAPDEWCELVEAGGHFKVAACPCECKIVWKFPLSMIGAVMGGGALIGGFIDLVKLKFSRRS